ncbi:MAG: hypothetical protein WC796_03630 [Candidatus Pacearchaeota archaeon]|jgi:hypothetical protein
MKRIIWDTDELPQREVVGPKAYNLMVMKRAGIPIPRFFTVLSDGSTDTTLEDSIVEASLTLGDDLIVRSCHPMESGKHPFSGKFLSDWCPNEPERIRESYQEIRQSARSEAVRQYIEEQVITDFNPEAMNVMFTPNFRHRFFGMFMTSAQNNPNEMILNYWDGIKAKGRWEIYDKPSRKIKSTGFFNDENLEAINQFGEVGIRVEELFGKPVQLEAGINEEGLLQVFQAKEIELTDPRSLARPPEYSTMITGLHAQGYASFRGPVLVLDELREVFPEQRWSTEEEKRRLVQQYQAEIAEFRTHNPKYVVVLKELIDLIGVEKPFASREERYAYLNDILKGGVIQMRSKAQSVVRHESWNSVETGGAIIYIDVDDESRFGHRFSHKPKYPTETRESKPRLSSNESIYTHNGVLVPINMVYRNEICTGDNLDVLCNEDGVFVW